MSDLTEFLLARIADDEECWRTVYAPTNPMGDFLKRECKAKRHMAAMLADSFGQPIDERARWTLAAFAAVYADHPDYDEAWRA